MYTIELIERFKSSKNLASDYAAAKALDVSQQSLSNYRNGVSHADDRVCVILAEALGLDPLATIARVNVDRAKNEKERAFWRRYSTAAAVCLSVIYSFALSTNASAAPCPNEQISRPTVYYVKFSRDLWPATGPSGLSVLIECYSARNMRLARR